MKSKKTFRGLSGFDLKCLAMILMVLDHIHYFFDFTGRIPLFFFSLASCPAGCFCSVQSKASRTPPIAGGMFCAAAALRRGWA